MANRPPVACTLSPEDYTERLAWIARLNRESLRSQRQEDLTLDLMYDVAARASVHELVRREAKCCSFLHFVITETADAIHLRIEAPEDVRDSTGTNVQVLFEPFLVGS
jgi:hypothetical protein